MKKLITLLLLTMSGALQAVILRNGKEADDCKSKEIYKTLKNINTNEQNRMYCLIWSIVEACRQEKAQNCDLQKLDPRVYLAANDLDEKTVQKLTDMQIVVDGKIDAETQNIINSSFIGTGDPKLLGIFIKLVNPVDLQATWQAQALKKHIEKCHQKKPQN